VVTNSIVIEYTLNYTINSFYYPINIMKPFFVNLIKFELWKLN